MTKVRYNPNGHGLGNGTGSGHGLGSGYSNSSSCSEYFLLSKNEYKFNNAITKLFPGFEFLIKTPILYMRIVTEIKIDSAHL